MTEEQVRQIVQSEIQRQNSGARFAMNPSQYHTHDKINSPAIDSNNLIPSVVTSGSVTFQQATSYTFNLNTNFTPSLILAYGIANNGVGAPATIRAHTIGSARLGQGFYLQPKNTTEVVMGGPPQQIIQSSSYISVENGGTFHALTDEGNIVDVEYGGTIYARATVTAFSRTAITINVPFLEAGWQIIVNYVIS